jgi:predicted nuclease with TOPRIM domain
VLYVCVHCSKKEQFIKDILEKTAGTQICLMRIIEFMDRHIENIMEIREILEKVEELELENDMLKEQLRGENSRNNEIAERLEIIMADYRTLEEECDALKADKAEVLKELNIPIMAEYITLYKNIQSEHA